MKNTKAKLQMIANYFKSCEPTLLLLPSVEDGINDEILLLGNGDMIWLAEKEGPEVPLLSIDSLCEKESTQDLVFDLFSAQEEAKVDAKKLFNFENSLRKALKGAGLNDEEVREIRIAFMDAKESILNTDWF